MLVNLSSQVGQPQWYQHFWGRRDRTFRLDSPQNFASFLVEPRVTIYLLIHISKKHLEWGKFAYQRSVKDMFNM